MGLGVSGQAQVKGYPLRMRTQIFSSLPNKINSLWSKADLSVNPSSPHFEASVLSL